MTQPADIVRRWLDHGGTCRVDERPDGRTTITLCRCDGGEVVDVLHTRDDDAITLARGSTEADGENAIVPVIMDRNGHGSSRTRRSTNLPHQNDPEFASLIQTLSAASDTNSSVDQVTTFAKLTFNADYAGITRLHAGGRMETVGATSPVARDLDSLQYRLSEGPCVEAATDEAVVLSGDVATDKRWPVWGPAAAEAGVNSMLSARLYGAGRLIGGLNLYGSEKDQFSALDADALELFCDHVAASLAMMIKVDTLEIAVEARTVIGQAQGILMERYGIEALPAFALLRRYSQASNRKIRDIAEDVVARRSLPDVDA